jgi:glutathione S-transferase
MTLIYHIASAAEWEQALRDGAYTTSTRGRTLAEQGFIHASTAGQVAPVANSFYADAPDPLLLVIDTDRVTAEIRHDEVPGWDEPFPHIYGPLNPDAVVETRQLERDVDGQFVFTA